MPNISPLIQNDNNWIKLSKLKTVSYPPALPKLSIFSNCTYKPIKNLLVIPPPYGSTVGKYLVYCVFICLFLCMVMDFSEQEKDNGMKLCMLLRLLSGMSFSHFGELWPRGGFPRSPEAYIQIAPGKKIWYMSNRYTNRTWEKILRRGLVGSRK